MSAEIINGQSVAGKRTVLADVLPLATPFLVQIFPVYACNFKCNYCVHSVATENRNFIANNSFLDFELFKKSIDDLKGFPQKIKMLRFAGTGEPLLHPKIAEMIEYAKDANIADSIDIVSNGSLLTKDLGDKLINAGLDWLRISIQGVTSIRYKEISAINLDIESLIDSISYFFKNKKESKVYIKTIDIDMSDNEKKRFYSIFTHISDKIAIEHLTPAVDKIDYSKLSTHALEITQNGNSVIEADVCPQPFYMMQINPDGNVVPCCAMETAIILGNCSQNSLLEIWINQKTRSFQKMMLNNDKSKNQTCSNCENYRYGMFEEDILDGSVEDLLEKWKEL